MDAKLASRLQTKVKALVSEAKGHPLARIVLSDNVDEATLRAAVRGVLLRVHYYGPSLTRSIFHAIGRIAAGDPDTARALAELEFEEAPHPALAFRDFVRMGGDPAFEDQTRHSPAAFVVAATAGRLAHEENPYAILGSLHLLEATTPAIIEDIAPSPRVRPLVEAFEFLSLHRTQDLDHTATLIRLIDEVSARDEEAARAIEFGHDCFAQVYPLPVWTEVLAEVQSGATQPEPWSGG